LAKRGFILANGVGVIDSDYRGEIHVPLWYLGGEGLPKKAVLPAGIRVAQLIIVPYKKVQIDPVQSLPETARGTGGFGSTGE
jgi:dUTP pyrophosphatase